MGVYRILVHSMVDAIEQASVRKGFDPREFVLVAEGGGGPLFAPEIAPEVGVKNVLVPSYPGHHRGARPADDRHGLRVRRDVVRDGLGAVRRPRRLRDARGAVREAPGRGARAVRDDGIARDQVRLENIAEARYEGQGYELRIDVGTGDDRRRPGSTP